MGMIEIGAVKTAEEVRKFWKEFRDISRGNAGMERIEPLLDGERFFIGEGQVFAVFSGTKLLDCCSGPGAFLYHKTFEPGAYVSRAADFSAVAAGHEDCFCSKPEEGAAPVAYIIRLEKTLRIPFTFDEAVYHDLSYDMDVVLTGSGRIEVGLADFPFCYAAAGYDVEKLAEKDFLTFSEEEKQTLAVDFENAFEKTLIRLKDVDIDYNRLAYRTAEVIALANEELLPRWGMEKGISAVSMEFSSIYPDDKSMLAMVQKRRAGQVKPQTRE